MLKVGHVFTKDGTTYCVIDILNFNSKCYAFLSLEKEKLEYAFFEVNKYDSGYSFDRVSDDTLNNQLFEIEEGR